MNDQCFNFALTDYVKQDRPGSVLGNVTLYKYPDKQLCVYETLQAYYTRILNRLKQSRRRLLYVGSKPSLLRRVYIDTTVFTAHSTQSASTSKAAAAAVPVDVILATAGWSTESTFRL